MADRLVDQHLRLLPRAIYAEQGNEGRLARLGVLAQRLAGARAVALDIQQVIGNLKGKAQVACIAAQGRAAFRRYSAHDCARFQAKADERTRSEAHTSELQSLMRISYAVFRLKKKKIQKQN